MEKMIFLVNYSVRQVKVEKDTALLKWNFQEGKQSIYLKKSELLLDPLLFFK